MNWLVANPCDSESNSNILGKKGEPSSFSSTTLCVRACVCVIDSKFLLHWFLRNMLSIPKAWPLSPPACKTIPRCLSVGGYKHESNPTDSPIKKEWSFWKVLLATWTPACLCLSFCVRGYELLTWLKFKTKRSGGKKHCFIQASRWHE